MAQASKKIQKAFQRKCPNCGAPLRFDPSSGKLSCSHCKSLVDFEQSKDVVERDFSEMYDYTPWKEGEVSAYRCSNCGASSVLSRTALATTCPFCDSPVVVDEKATGLVRPDSLVPFELNEAEAEAQLAAWRRRKAFAPNNFRKHTKAKSVKGVYVPVWTFDAETVSHYTGRLGKRKTRTVRRNGKTYTETYIDWFYVNGEISAYFDDIMVAGSKNVDATYYTEAQYVDKSKYAVYSDEYLAGYMADNYTVEPAEAYKTARKLMDNAIRNKILSRYNADVVGSLDVKTTETGRSFKYMLMPVYVAATKYKDKIYNQYVSGFWSSKDRKKAHVSGTFPRSPWKRFGVILAGILAAAGIIALIVYACLHGESNGWELDLMHRTLLR